MNIKNFKIEASFENRILSVKFLENAVIDEADIQAIYTFGNEKAMRKAYCIIFEASGHYELTEEAVQYMATNPNNANILAKVYVINTKEAERKTKLHLAFDKPELKPLIFNTAQEGLNYLTAIINKN